MVALDTTNNVSSYRIFLLFLRRFDLAYTWTWTCLLYRNRIMSEQNALQPPWRAFSNGFSCQFAQKMLDLNQLPDQRVAQAVKLLSSHRHRWCAIHWCNCSVRKHWNAQEEFGLEELDVVEEESIWYASSLVSPGRCDNAMQGSFAHGRHKHGFQFKQFSWWNVRIDVGIFSLEFQLKVKVYCRDMQHVLQAHTWRDARVRKPRTHSCMAGAFGMTHVAMRTWRLTRDTFLRRQLRVLLCQSLHAKDDFTLRTAHSPLASISINTTIVTKVLGLHSVRRFLPLVRLLSYGRVHGAICSSTMRQLVFNPFKLFANDTSTSLGLLSFPLSEGASFFIFCLKRFREQTYHLARSLRWIRIPLLMNPSGKLLTSVNPDNSHLQKPNARIIREHF